MSLANRVEQAIQFTGLSRTQFAHRCGVAQPRLHAIIHEQTKNPTVDTLIKIADTAGVSIEWLATERGDMFAKTPKADETAQMAAKFQQIGGPITEREFGTLRMLRKIESRDKEKFRAIQDRITLDFLELTE